MFARLAAPAVAAASLMALSAGAQILPNDAESPVRVVKGRGEFAAKLNGVKMPSGKGWKPAMDRDKWVQIMVPDRWKVEPDPNGDAILRAVPPGSGKVPTAVLLVLMSAPRDADPLEVEESFALAYADDLAADPMLKQLQFKPTDSAYLINRGMRFALAGGTVIGDKKEVFQQEQLIFISEDRIVNIQFTAREKDFPRYADDVARIFASYQTIATRKIED
jgi:hypothetical protein